MITIALWTHQFRVDFPLARRTPSRLGCNWWWHSTVSRSRSLRTDTCFSILRCKFFGKITWLTPNIGALGGRSCTIEVRASSEINVHMGIRTEWTGQLRIRTLIASSAPSSFIRIARFHCAVGRTDSRDQNESSNNNNWSPHWVVLVKFKLQTLIGV